MRFAGFVAVLFAIAVAVTTAQRVSYKGYSKVQFSVPALDKVDLVKLDDEIEGLNVLGARGNVVDALVNKEAMRKLRTMNLLGDMKIEVEDVQTRIDSLTPSANIAWNSVGSDSPFFDTFRTYDEIGVYMDQLVANYSRILTKFVAGTTIQGRTIYGLRLSNGLGGTKPSMFMQALVHAREWLAPPTNLYAVTRMCEEYYAGIGDVVQLIEGMDYYFVPVVNVDGYIYTWTDDRYWRKNRRANANGSFGVDINRNWGPANTWCTAGSSTLPASDTYCGTAPFSEPETRSMGNWIDSLNDLRAGVDFHCYGPLILRPFQYSYSSPPEPYNGEATRVGLEMEQVIRSVHNTAFDSIPGSELYPHSGGLIDYTYFTRNALAYTIELRGNDFVVPASYIRLSGEEAYPGVLTLAENALFSKKLTKA